MVNIAYFLTAFAAATAAMPAVTPNEPSSLHEARAGQVRLMPILIYASLTDTL